MPSVFDMDHTIEPNNPIDSMLNSFRVQVSYSSYPFLSLLRVQNLSKLDLRFLKDHGCFLVPAKPILDEFIQQYFLHVHPLLPVLDETEFWGMYSGRTCLDFIVIFTTSRKNCREVLSVIQFVTVATLRKLGISSPIQAASILYRRAKLIFDFDCEPSALSIAQASLLLSHHTSDQDGKKNTFWLMIACENAKDCSAHNYQSIENISEKERAMLKRLWWCCIVRDRILALGTRRSLQITPDMFNFKSASFSSKDLQGEIDLSRVYSLETKQGLANLFAMLSIVWARNSALILPNTQENDSLALSIAKFDECTDGLSQWYSGAITHFPTPAGLGNTHDSLILFTNLMYIYYYSAKLSLSQHKALFLMTTPYHSNDHSTLIQQANNETKDSVLGIAENLKELVQLRLAKYLPFSAAPYITLPYILHILDAQFASTASAIAVKQRRLEIFREAMKIHGSRFGATSRISALAEIISSKIIPTKGIEGDSSEPGSNFRDMLQSESPPNSSCITAASWWDLLISQPSSFFQITYSIDHCFSRAIQEINPPILSLKSSREACHSRHGPSNDRVSTTCEVNGSRRGHDAGGGMQDQAALEADVLQNPSYDAYNAFSGTNPHDIMSSQPSAIVDMELENQLSWTALGPLDFNLF
ncbi:hypothetical protein B0O99DRAFT_590435 [Bisporella sp. PMI_857]|nr:hypothetical protein B0O99DRAFT_590435 [Bisporella sp. PMI_857]